MYFTKAQQQALWFIIIIFGIAVFFHYIKYWFFRPDIADLNEFKKEFLRKRDSILQVQKQDSLDMIDNLRKKLAVSLSHSSATQVNFPININNADKEELQALPRVGPVTAAKIIAYRNQHGKFSAKEDIKKVKGIGKKTFEKLEELITVK